MLEPSNCFRRPAYDVTFLRKSWARTNGRYFSSSISLENLLQVDNSGCWVSSNEIVMGGGLSHEGFQAQRSILIKDNAASTPSQMSGAVGCLLLWTTLKHPTYPTTRAMLPTRRMMRRGHINPEFLLTVTSFVFSLCNFSARPGSAEKKLLLRSWLLALYLLKPHLHYEDSFASAAYQYHFRAPTNVVPMLCKCQ